MNQAEQTAFNDLGAKVDVLSSAIDGLTTEIASEKQALSDALAANDTAGVLVAAATLSSKLDAAQAKAAAALAPVLPPVDPTPPAPVA